MMGCSGLSNYFQYQYLTKIFDSINEWDASENRAKKIEFNFATMDTSLLVKNSLSISGHSLKRTIWMSSKQNHLIIDEGATLSLHNFDFISSGSNLPMIHLKSGHLFIKDASFDLRFQNAIQADSGTTVVLENVLMSGKTVEALAANGADVTLKNVEYLISQGSAFGINNFNNVVINTLKISERTTRSPSLGNGLNATIDDVEIQGQMDDGFKFWSVDSIQLNNISVSQVDGNGLSFDNCRSISIHDGQFRENGKSGIFINNSETVRIDSMQYIDNEESGIWIRDVQNMSAQRSIAKSNRTHGFKIERIGSADIRHINAIGNLESGLLCSGIETLNLHYVHSQISGNNGIELDNITSLSMGKIESSRNIDAGIYVRNSQHVILKNSIVSQNKAANIDASMIHDFAIDNLELFKSPNALILHKVNESYISNLSIKESAMGSQFLSVQNGIMTNSTLLGCDTSLVSNQSHLSLYKSKINSSKLGILSNESIIQLDSSIIINCKNGIEINGGELNLNRVEIIDFVTGLIGNGNSKVAIQQSYFAKGQSAFLLNDHSSLELIYSRFDFVDSPLKSKTEKTVIFTNSKIENSKIGIKIYAGVIDISKMIFENNDQCFFELSPQSNTTIRHTTFIKNKRIFHPTNDSYGLFDRNIVTETSEIRKHWPPSLETSFTCFWKNAMIPEGISMSNRNMYKNPKLDENLIPGNDSPCLLTDATTIGAFSPK